MQPPVYVGNYEFDVDERELERHIEQFGQIKNIEFKRGFCFVHFEDPSSAEECIRSLDGSEFGKNPRRLRVELAKNDAGIRERQQSRRQVAEPNTTLFVAGFPKTTQVQDLEEMFEKFGRLRRCEIKKTFAFIDFEDIKDAEAALQGTHGTKMDGGDITVEYVVGKERDRSDRPPRRDRFDGDRRGGRFGSHDRRGSPPRHGGYDRRRSRSPPRRRRSPPYGGGGYGGGGGGGGRDRNYSPRRRHSPARRRASPSPPQFHRKERSRSPQTRDRSPM